MRTLVTQRPCLGVGGRMCGALISVTARRCGECQRGELRRKQAARPEGEHAFYSSAAWQRLRREVLADAEACAWCGATGVKLTAGHVEPMRQRPDLALEPSNVAPSCRSCQIRVQRRSSLTGGYPRGAIKSL